MHTYPFFSVMFFMRLSFLFDKILIRQTYHQINYEFSTINNQLIELKADQKVNIPYTYLSTNMC
jgi:hypothetical protein